MKFLVSGYYGFGNLGDETILSALAKELREWFPQAEIVVLSAMPEETAKQYHVRAINRWDLMGVQRELQSATAFISGGGGLIQDQTSRRSALYYLALIALARRRCPVYLIGQGIGPIRSRFVRAWSERLLRRVDLAMVRDEISREVLRDWGLPEERLVLGGDLALLLWPQFESLRETSALGDEGPYLAICLKGKLSEKLKASVVEQLDRWSELQNTKITFIALYPEEDLEGMEEIASRMKRSTKVLSFAKLGLKSAMECIGHAQAIVGMRLHALIFALLTARPFVALGDDHKLEAFVKRIEAADGSISSCCTLTRPDAQGTELAQLLMCLNGNDEIQHARLVQAGETLYRQTRQTVNAVWKRLSDQIEAGGRVS
ncbi:MAG: polysaccharide pyruvyl transferase CsaB [Candidatus Fraserbacteria bacterium RBG_16_55_9]|uniref:Polysaccharide pyruvyl transferase CsaB n=1 Tax=Fraserbacteria sp. (strain RBG_16_55_9) TaxID=1817864 RepID=A0A1F5UNQ3_FRAXR|nr:MAG: polysaccharide pyruvyl transferase CsaB [Candidatus Fraserbacteria bacterium RBG_16_55_9]